MIEKIIAENLGIKVDSIKDESNFVNDLGADSLNIVELVMAVEEEFEIEIPGRSIDQILFSALWPTTSGSVGPRPMRLRPEPGPFAIGGRSPEEHVPEICVQCCKLISVW